MLRMILIFLLIGMGLPAFAAKPDGLADPQARPELYRLKNPVARVQELLKSQGRYEGAVDGFMGSDLERAIRLYQKEQGLPQTGKISAELIAHLENVGRIRALITRLEDVRRQRQEKARQALLSDPRTRQLLDQKDYKTADPTRDMSHCFAQPTSGCLLRAAVEASKAVYEDDMRDWALGEILAAQVAVGQEGDALKTAARIKDSRLIIAALTNIAKTHAREGKIEEALSSLDLIPVIERRLSVLLEIAKVYRAENRKKDLKHIVDNILATAAGLDSFEEGLSLQIEAAELLADVESKRALNLLDAMSERARTKAQNGSKITLMRQAAGAIAKIGYPEWALKVLEKMPDDETRIPVLMAAARAFLKAQRFNAARETIERISAKRYRSVILADMAGQMWQAGKHKDALNVLGEALVIAKGVKLPFARNFSLFNIAQTLREIAENSQESVHAAQAYAILQEISDDRLKARGLWDLAHAASLKNFSVENTDLDSVAQVAIGAIKSKFSRVWVLGDLVEYYQREHEPERAKRAFDLGLATVEELKNPWARSRALAKFAALAYRFD